MFILDSDSFFFKIRVRVQVEEIRETRQLEVDFLHSWVVALPKF